MCSNLKLVFFSVFASQSYLLFSAFSHGFRNDNVFLFFFYSSFRFAFSSFFPIQQYTDPILNNTLKFNINHHAQYSLPYSPRAFLHIMPISPGETTSSGETISSGQSSKSGKYTGE